MKSKNDLFELINSMTTAEKRYFKINSTKYDSKKSNLSIQLFDLISKKGVEDDTFLQKALKQNLSTGHFSVLKNNLYISVLNSLTEYAKKNQISIPDRISQIQFLKKRGLIKQAKELLLQTKKEIKVSRPTLNLELLEIEIELFMNNPESYHQIDITKHFSAQNRYIKQIKLLNFYKQLYTEKELATQQRTYSNSFDFKEILSRIKDKSESNLLNKEHTFESKFYALLINKHCCIQIGELDNFHRYAELLVNHLKDNPKEVLQDPEKIIWGYYSRIYSLILLNKSTSELDAIFEEYEEAIIKFMRIDKSTQYLAHTILHYFTLRRATILKDKKLSNHQLKEIQHFIDRNSELIPKQYVMNLKYLIAYYNFIQHDYRNAINNAESAILEYHNHDKIGKGIFISAKILQTISYHELGETNLQKSSLRSLYRYLSLENSKRIDDKTLVKFLSLVLRSNTSLNKLYELYDELNHQNDLDSFSNHFNFKEYLETKLNPSSILK